MKKHLILLLAAMLAIGVAACGSEDKSLGEITAYTPEAEDFEEIDVGDEVPGNAIVRTDDDGLVSVRVKDGSAEIYFHLEEWGDLNSGQDGFTEGPFQIVTMSGAAVDAMVGKISALDMSGGQEKMFPSVALLTEHGRVEYLLADPSVGWQENEYMSFGVLPWLKDIESFSFNDQGLGYGETTIYAWDKEGYQYDIARVCRLVNIFNENGIWEFFYTNDSGVELYLGMALTEGGTMDLVLGSAFGDEPGFETEQTYSGAYEVFLASNGERNAGEMDVNLDCTWWIAELDENTAEIDMIYWDERMNIEGTYTFRTQGDGYLNLSMWSGDALMHTGWRGEPITEYNFWQTMFF